MAGAEYQSDPLCRGTVELPLLSFQEGRLIMDERSLNESAPSIRTIPFNYRVRGSLNARGLVRALHELVLRHEALRVFFPPENEKQVIADPLPLRVPVIELRAAAPSELERIIEDLLRALALEPFDPRQPPRIRAAIIDLGPDDNIVSVVLDHLVVDGWSCRILMTELSELYEAVVKGRRHSLPKVPYCYREYVRDQHGALQADRRGELLSYWARRTNGVGAVPRVAFPTWALSQNVPVGVGTRVLNIERDVARALNEFHRRERVTIFVTFVAALTAALVRFTDEDSQAIVAHVMKRDTLDAESLVAPLSDLLLVRVDLSKGLTLRDVVARVQRSVTEAYEYGDLPYGELVKALAPEIYGDPRVPIGMICNVVYPDLFNGLRLYNLECTPLVLEQTARPRCVLGITASVSKEDLAIHAQYQRDRLKDSFVDVYLDSVEALLRAMGDAPETSVDTVIGLDRVHGFDRGA